MRSYRERILLVFGILLGSVVCLAADAKRDYLEMAREQQEAYLKGVLQQRNEAIATFMGVIEKASNDYMENRQPYVDAMNACAQMRATEAVTSLIVKIDFSRHHPAVGTSPPSQLVLKQAKFLT